MRAWSSSSDEEEVVELTAGEEAVDAPPELGEDDDDDDDDGDGDEDGDDDDDDVAGADVVDFDADEDDEGGCVVDCVDC